MAHWIVASIIGSLAFIGMLTVCWVVAGWAERAADWLRDRQDARESGVPVSGFRRLRKWEARGEEENLPPLPPERTWEQMISHQLPLADPRQERISHRGPAMSPAERKHWHKLERARRQRCRRVEMTHRAHYAAMGLDYPSGLMARMRELTP